MNGNRREDGGTRGRGDPEPKVKSVHANIKTLFPYGTSPRPRVAPSPRSLSPPRPLTHGINTIFPNAPGCITAS
jgi:hypothetical protein